MYTYIYTYTHIHTQRETHTYMIREVAQHAGFEGILGKSKIKYSSAFGAAVSVWKMLLQLVCQGCPWFIQIPKSVDMTLNAAFFGMLLLKESKGV